MFYNYRVKLDKTIEILKYITNTLSDESTQIIYNANNIIREKCELYNDYIQSLILLVFDTYMGDDIMDGDDKRNHFNWCWKKNVQNFKSENITIDSKELYDYLITFVFEIFYIRDNKDDTQKIQEYMQKASQNIFSLDIKKTKSDIDGLVELYNVFEKSIKNN